MVTHKSINKDIVCGLFPAQALKPKVNASGIVTAPKSVLVGLKVKADYVPLGVHGDHFDARYPIQKNSVVYVLVQYANSQWAKAVFEHPELGEFILVPSDLVVLVERPDYGSSCTGPG
jgi:hypothetical protein